MNISGSIKSGFYRSIRSWKGVMIVWLVFLALATTLTIPLKSSLKFALDASMLPKQLADGFNILVFTDPGPLFKSIGAFFSGGFYIIFIIGIILNAFLTGGLFDSIRKGSERFSSSGFFRAGAKNFWSFLIITLIITLIFIFTSATIFLIAGIIVSSADGLSEKGVLLIIFGTVAIISLLLPVLLLVADYSRAWSAANESGSPFRALGFGFSRTFGRFLTSYTTMLLMVLTQILSGLLIMFLLPGRMPETGSGLVILFFLSQLLIYARYLLKTWRYASITSLME